MKGAQKSQVLSALEAVGFSLNESRAYAALLEESPATGYEVGVRAHVPRSAVYGVLRRLVETGSARSIPGRPERFVPVPLEDVLGLLKRRFDASATDLQRIASQLRFVTPAPDVFTVQGYPRIVEEAARVIRGARATLVVSGWPREIERLAGDIHAADAVGAYVVTFSHGGLPALPGEVFTYALAERDLEDFWKHRLIVVADDRSTLIGATEMLDDDSAVVSQTVAIAEVAASQVALDITLLSQRFGRDVSQVMGRMLGARVGRLDTLLAR